MTVDGKDLIFFHFHKLERLARAIYAADFRTFGKLSDALCRLVYAPYLKRLDQIESMVSLLRL